jgi:hypothetical protein
MYTTRPCTATCVIDGAPVTFTFYPDTCVLRVCDAMGHCLREDRWEASWAQLLASIRELAQAGGAKDKGLAVGGVESAPANDKHVEAA